MEVGAVVELDPKVQQFVVLLDCRTVEDVPEGLDE